jgi:hypothetical protein
MANWRTEMRTCFCGTIFTPNRGKQRYCTTRCGTRARVNQYRTRYRESEPTALPEKPLQTAQAQTKGVGDGPSMVWPERNNGPTPGALQDDDVPLEYYEDGYPKLPACLKTMQAQITCGGRLMKRPSAPVLPQRR